MALQLSSHFGYKELLRFTSPSIFMMILGSVYGIVDGLFVSNLVGENAFAAVNIASTVVFTISSIGHLIGTGGSAVIARTLGEGKKEDANRYFTMILGFGMSLTLFFTVLCLLFVEPLMRFAGASDLIIDYCTQYATILLLGIPLYVLQNTFSKFLIVMEKPKLGLYISIVAGVTNMVLDYVFVAPSLCNMGVAGAAWATVIGYAIGGITPVIYVIINNGLNLRFRKTKIESRILTQTTAFGTSAMIANLATSICGVILNSILMNLVGEAGIAAYGVVLYLDFIFLGVFNGYTVGISPVISFHYGAEHKEEQQSLIKKSFILIAVFSVASVLISQLCAKPVAMAFIQTQDILSMTIEGIRLCALMYIFTGVSLFATGLFSALSNGRVSFVLSILRTVAKITFVYLLTAWIGMKGVWLCGLCADVVTAAVALLWYRQSGNIN